MPTPRAPTTSVSRSSPTIHVIDGLGVERAAGGVEVGDARLAEHGRLGLRRVLEPGDVTAGVEQRPVLSSATSGCGGGSRARRRPRAPRTRARGSCTRRRGSSRATRRAPPIRTASASSPTSSTPSRSPTSACMTSARTRRPRSASTAASAVVCTSSTSSSIPIACRPAARSAFERVVAFVTKRSRWPASRSRRTASAAPGSGWPETCRTPSTSSRIAAMAAESIRVTRSRRAPAGRGRAAGVPLERARRPARAEVRDAGRRRLRRRGARTR